MTNKKTQVWLPLLFSLTMVVGMYLGYRMRDAMPGKGFFYRQQNGPVQEMLDLLGSKYVDEVATQELADTAIQAILCKLDPHSTYIPASETQLRSDEMAGRFYGMGINFETYNDTINILSVLKEGPAYRAGVQPGDQFVKVGDSMVSGVKITSKRLHHIFRKAPSKQLVISLLRNGVSKQVTITLGSMPLNSVAAHYMVTPDIGYIRLEKFTQATYREFMQALDTLHSRGLKKLILDLRGNGGGVLEPATAIADEFLEGDKLITYTIGQHSPRKEYRCQKVGMFEKEPLVVLADEACASASEALLGALQDWDRGIIVGRRSFGKGLVQNQYQLSDGSAIRLTTARYYTPLGRSIQRSYANGHDAYLADVGNPSNWNRRNRADSANLGTVFTTPKGKKLYGAGGIFPDVFVPYDSSLYMMANNKHHEMSAASTVEFAYRYFVRNMAALKAYPTPASFNSGFALTDADWQMLVQTAAKDSVSLGNASPAQKQQLLSEVKACVASHLWRSAGFYEVMNGQDPIVRKAIELLGQ
jgi:carboxyl-terminal processing protease